MANGPDSNLKPIRVLVVDDHRMMREGLRFALRQEPDLTLVGEAEDGSTALRLAVELCPEVIIMDIDLPDADGVDLSRQMLTRCPGVRIVILSGWADSQHLEEALAAGVAGYVAKASAASELISAIRAVMRNETYVCPELSTTLAGSYKELLVAKRLDDQSALSDREVEVLKLVANGCNTKEIADRLALSIKTVESHRKRIMAKLGLHSVAELTKYALRKGLTSL